MEAIGRIMRVLPQRSGFSERTHTDWVAQPFVFEYFETSDQRVSDKMLLETFDANVILQIQENMKARVVVGHNIREYDGRVYNEIKLYRMEVIGSADPNAATSPAT